MTTVSSGPTGPWGGQWISVLDSDQEPILVRYCELTPEALRGVVESFVLREGTDYGEQAFSLEQKFSHVMRQLERGEAHILFDPRSETVDIVPAQSLPGAKLPGV